MPPYLVLASLHLNAFPLSTNNLEVDLNWYQILTNLGFFQVSAHWMRHAYAQHSLADGAPLLVRDSLGYSSIVVTNIYLELMPEDSSSKYLGL